MRVIMVPGSDVHGALLRAFVQRSPAPMQQQLSTALSQYGSMMALYEKARAGGGGGGGGPHFLTGRLALTGRCGLSARRRSRPCTADLTPLSSDTRALFTLLVSLTPRAAAEPVSEPACGVTGTLGAFLRSCASSESRRSSSSILHHTTRRGRRERVACRQTHT